MKGAKIVKAVPSDALPLSRIECRAWKTPWVKYSFWNWVIGIRYHRVFKAVVGGKIAGAVLSVDLPDGSVYVDQVIVSPKYQHMGIGSALLRKAMKDTEGHRLIALTWTTNDPSKGLLHKHGFRAMRKVGHLFASEKDYIEYETANKGR